jgi:hypothetical protein
MKSFYHYLAESTKSYGYRVKSVAPMDDHFVDTLKKSLFKYDVQSVSTPKKLMAQKSPLDFRNFPMAEIWVLDIKTGVPASSYVLASELRGALQVADGMLIVRGENEPLAIEAEAIEEIHKDDQTRAILDDPNYDHEDQPREVAFGDAYNKKFLSYLAQKRANAQPPEIPAFEEIKKVNKFSWLNKKDTFVGDDFNAQMDTVKPVHVNSKKSGAKAEEPNLAGNHGNYDQNVKRRG